MKIQFVLLLIFLQGLSCFWFEECNILPSLGCVCNQPYLLPEVDCRHLDLEVIPMVITDGTDGVGILDLSHNDFTDVDISQFGEVSVSSLIVSNNKRPIMSITFSALQRQNIIRLTLSNNSLEEIPSLQNMSKLEYLDLSHNYIKSITSEAGQLEGLHSLTNLDISDNPISAMDSNVFPDLLSHVEILKVSFRFDIPHWPSPRNKNHLQETLTDLEFVKAPMLSLDWLAHFHQLTRVVFIECGSWVPIVDLFQNVHLKHVIYSKHNLDTMNFLQDSNRQLESLDLSHNLIRLIYKPDSDINPQLEYLDLSYNKLNVLHDWPEPLQALRHLDLSHNLLRIIHYQSVGTLPHLEFLDLSYNHAYSIVPADYSFRPFPEGATVILTGSDSLDCCRHDWLRREFRKQIREGSGPYTWYDIYNVRCNSILSTSNIITLLDRPDWLGPIEGHCVSLHNREILDLINGYY